MKSCTPNNELDHKLLQQKLSRSLGPRMGVAVSSAKGDIRCLYPEEARSIHKAVPKRQEEFAAGRHVARCAMSAIGWQVMPVPCRVDRSPKWPKGLVGSISHSDTTCVAVVSRSEHAISVGIDIEDARPIETDLWPSICTPQELEVINRHRSDDRAAMVLHIFSAKECYYKWQYPVTGLFLEFQDVSISFDSNRNTFEALRNANNLSRESTGRVQGKFFADDKWVISAIV